MSDKLAFRIVAAVTIAVPAVVLLLYLLPKSETVPSFVTHCPLLNATLNGTCTVLLTISYFAIRRKKVNLHKRLNITAFILSALFLLSYVTYHFFGKETLFPKDNSLKATLFNNTRITHYSFGYCAAYGAAFILLWAYQPGSQHRKISRWTMPIWLYVTITGVLVYL